MTGRTDDRGSLPLVSVVIPTYGRNDTLVEAVRSVADQTYDRIELLVVDDGSPTPVTETLDADLDDLESVTFIRHDSNRGANVARNTGIRAAAGDYVAFLDDDDRWMETKVDKQVAAFLESGPEVGVVYTGKRTVNPGGTQVFVPSAEGEVLTDLLTGAQFGQFSSVMVQADVIDDAGLPDETFPAWQDREWFFRLAQHCEFQAVREPLTVRRTGLPDSITKQFETRRDVAYPLFVEKYYPLAREHGWYFARKFLATLRMDLARSAVKAGRYREARRLFLLAFLANPLYRPVHKNLLASLGGKWTYKPAAALRRKLSALLSSPDRSG